MVCLLGIKAKLLHPWKPLMKISLGVLQMIELLSFVQDEVIFSALHTYISALERRCLNSLYSIHRFIGMTFRNE